MIDIVDAGLYILIAIILSSFAITLCIYFLILNYKKKQVNRCPDPKQTEANIALNNFDFISPKEVQSDGVLPVSSALVGVISLEVFARKKKPKYIIGVNRGGWLLSTYLAHRLNIDRNHLLRFDSDKGVIIDDVKYIKLESQDVLLVDDISRTGKSIEKAIEYLKSNFSDCNISITVLVICDKNSSREYVDFYPYYTYYPDVQLPWSSDERKKEAREAQLEASQGKVTNLADENSLNSRSPILRMAESQNPDAEGIDIATEDIELIISILDSMRPTAVQTV